MLTWPIRTNLISTHGKFPPGGHIGSWLHHLLTGCWHSLMQNKASYCHGVYVCHLNMLQTKGKLVFWTPCQVTSYAEAIFICFGLDHLCSQTTTRSAPTLVVLPVWRWDEWLIKTMFLDNFGLLTIRPRVGVCKQGIVTVHEPGSSVQPANPDAVSKWPGSNMAAPTAKLTTTWASTSSGKISIYWVSNSTKFTKWKLTFEARMFITSMSGGTFLQGRN